MILYNFFPFILVAAGAAGRQSQSDGDYVIGTVQARQNSVAPSECKAVCESPYDQAQACGVTENVINTNTLPPQCLCTGSFMQDTPPCINCLFSVTTQDDTYRPVLASAFDQCVSVYNAIPCPSFCGRVAPLVAYCNAIDNSTYPVSDPPPVGLPVSVSMSKPCICRDEYIQVVDECHSCVRDWDGVKAKEWLKSIEKCNTPAPTKTKTKQPPMQTPSPTAEQTVRPVESTAGISETKGNGASTINGWLSSGVVVHFLAICLAGPDSLLWIFV